MGGFLPFVRGVVMVLILLWMERESEATSANQPGPEEASTRTTTMTSTSTTSSSSKARRKSSAQLQLEYKERYGNRRPASRRLSSPSPLEQASERIVNGIDADTNSYRYFARLSIWNEGMILYNCGGVLISDRFVLTAAHCLWDFQEEWLRQDVFGATIGFNCEEADNCGHEFGIYRATHYWFHPDWNPQRSILDMALVRLNQTVTEARWAEPDVGNFYPTLKFGYEDGLRSVGFGVLTDSRARPTRLQELYLGFYPTNECEGIWGQLFNGVVCVYTNDKETGLYGRGLCFGDSGSPTVIPGAGRTPSDDVVVGLTSFGAVPCERKRRPDVLARVSAGIIYIASVVCYPGLSTFTPEWCGSLGWATGFVGSGDVNLDQSSQESEEYFNDVILQANSEQEKQEEEIRECRETSKTKYTINSDTGKRAKCKKVAGLKKSKKRIKACTMGKANAGQVCCRTCEEYFQATRRFLSTPTTTTTTTTTTATNKTFRQTKMKMPPSYYYYTVPPDFPPKEPQEAEAAAASS